MRAKLSTSLHTALALTLVVSAVPQASFAQSAGRHPTANSSPKTSNGTPEERKACLPDVQDLCDEVIAEEHSVILACLKSHWEKVSAACRTVVEKQGH